MNKYVFKSYNPIFPVLFEREHEKLKNILGNTITIEHIGSTAVAGVGGKGIIDIMIGIPKEKIFFSAIIKKLEDAGYEHREKADSLERIFFRIDRPDEVEKIRRYHIHVTYIDKKDWNETLTFRNYLRNTPQAVKEYENLKIDALKKSEQDGKMYRNLKQPFIEKYSR
jgi:GrpB-like predicted nucleotidyltransferase (UPF0157 family)